MPVVDYYYTGISTWTYLGSRSLESMLERTGAALRHFPVDLRAVWRACGGLPVAERPLQKQAYRLIEMQRWSRQRETPIRLRPAFFPANPAQADRMVIAAQREGWDATRLAHAVLRAVWWEDRDIADAPTLEAIADENGLPGSQLRAASEEESVRSEYLANTQRAIDRQVFGFPTYVLRAELFWGQDRIEELERAILEGRAPIVHADLDPL